MATTTQIGSVRTNCGLILGGGVQYRGNGAQAPLGYRCGGSWGLEEHSDAAHVLPTTHNDALLAVMSEERKVRDVAVINRP